MKNVKRVLAILLALAMVLCMVACGEKKEEAAAEPAKPAYPEGPIVCICNYSAGGGTDLVTRALCDYMSKSLGVAITVNNVTGGTGTVGVTELKNSKNDGYTFGTATVAPLSMAPHQMEVQYTLEDFEYLGTSNQYGYGIMTSVASGIDTLDKLIEKAQAGKVKFGCTGYPQPFFMADFGEEIGGEFEFVSYASSTDMVADILGGFIDVICAEESTYSSYVKSGQVNLLAAGSDKRWIVAPDTPTMLELGYKEQIKSFVGYCTPAGVDPEIVSTLEAALGDAVNNSQAFKDTCDKLNFVITYNDGAAFKDLCYEMDEYYAEMFDGK